MNDLLKGTLLGIALCLPCVTYAQIAITEIMYDLEGSDTDREWVEIQNTSSGDIDFSLWRFGEEGTNHKVSVVQGSAVLPPGGYAVIVQKLENFKVDWPQFGGTIFDSSFSLKQEGETLMIRDTDLKDIDTVSYTADKGGAGDGRSLQLVGGSFASGLPTPGSANAASSAPPAASLPAGTPAPVPTSATAPSSSSGGSMTSAPPPLPKSIRAVIDASGTTIVGGQADFRGSAYGFENKPLENTRFLWNFGDGGTAEGEHVLHTYAFPGRYALVLSVASGEFSATAHVTVEAVQPDVRLSRISRNGEVAYVLHNNLKETIDISGWRIVVGETVFTLPEHSFVVPQGQAVFPSKTTGLSATALSFSLAYPNGTLAETGADEQISTIAPAQMLSPSNLVAQTPVLKKEATTKSAPKKKVVAKKKEVAAAQNVVATTTAEVVPVAHTAAVGHTDGRIWKWMVALTLLVAGGAVAAVILRRKENDSITLVD